MINIIAILDFFLTGTFAIILKEYFDLFLIHRFFNQLYSYVVWGLYWILDYIINSYIDIQVDCRLFITFFAIFIVNLIVYKNKIKAILFSILLLECLGCISEIFVKIILGSASENEFIGSIFSKFLILILIRLIKFLKRQSNYEFMDNQSLVGFPKL